MRLAIIRALGLEPFLVRCLEVLDAGLRRWPWLYRKLGGVV